MNASSPALAIHPALTFFSTVTEEPLARLEAEAIGPRYTRHGPFRVPAPGVEIKTPTLILHDEPCTPDDWTRFLRHLASWRRTSVDDGLLLIAPDGRAFSFVGAPDLGPSALSGLVRPLADPAAPAPHQSDFWLLRVERGPDERLRLDLLRRPLPPPSPLPLRDEGSVSEPSPLSIEP